MIYGSDLLSKYLVKHYAIKPDNAMIMIEDEWDFIEDMMNTEHCNISQLAKDLVEIYMV